MTTRTYTPRAADIERNWFVVDATGQRLGTLASRVALVLEGKHKPTYATHIDTGDHVIVLNASRVDIGRGKAEQKKYSRHSGYPGGYREETLGDLLARRPEEVIRRAVKGMLPRNKLGVQQLRKLKIYSGSEHPHEAQQPEPLPGTSRAATADETANAATAATTARADDIRAAEQAPTEEPAGDTTAAETDTATEHTENAADATRDEAPETDSTGGSES